MELGVYTFAQLEPNPPDGEAISPAQRMRNLIEEIELSDQLDLDVFAVGEHHRPDFVVSAPAVVLGAAAVRTKKIRLSSVNGMLINCDGAAPRWIENDVSSCSKNSGFGKMKQRKSLLSNLSSVSVA